MMKGIRLSRRSWAVCAIVSVSSQCENEVRLYLVEHIRVAGERWDAATDFRDPVRRYVGPVIVDPDYIDIFHRREMAKVCRVIDGVPVADADCCNSDGHLITTYVRSLSLLACPKPGHRSDTETTSPVSKERLAAMPISADAAPCW